jgi:ParB family chromosome partitioning protein
VSEEVIVAKTNRIDEAASRQTIPVDLIDPDPQNRVVVDDEELRGLADSIRVLGLLQPIHVRAQSNGRFMIVDGERRWRSSMLAGLVEIPCEVWRADRAERDAKLAGVVLNEQRKAASCIHVARRLRDIKNEHGLTHDELARQTGLPVDRIKSYFALFGASDFLLGFCEKHELPLKTAVALVRYERATNEAKARRLVAQWSQWPLTCHEIDALRKRQERKAGEETRPGRDKQNRPRSFVVRLEQELSRDRAATIAELRELLERLGYRLVPAAEPHL